MTWTPKSIRWYVADMEAWADRRLPQVSGVFWWEPVVRIKRIVDGLWADATESMFPDYALSGSRDGWRHIEAAYGALLLRIGRAPRELSQIELDRIRQQEDVVVNHEPEFMRGQSVCVRVRARSSFAGLAGRFLKSVSVRGGKFAMVMFDLYGERQRVATVPVDYLEVAK